MALYLSRTHGISRIGSFDRLRTSSEFRRSESRGGGVAFGSTLKLDRSYEGDNQRYHTTSLSRIIGKLGLAMNFYSFFFSSKQGKKVCKITGILTLLLETILCELVRICSTGNAFLRLISGRKLHLFLGSRPVGPRLN